MKIAILAWGSLIWEKRDLDFIEEKGWARGGPGLPLEFARVSTTRKGALTLVIYPKTAGDDIPTRFAESKFPDLEKAILNLAAVEGTCKEKLGFVDCLSGQSRCQILPSAASKIHDWAEQNHFDAVIWTDLPSNFENVVKMEFTVDNAQRYLHSLKEEGAALAACEYIKSAPSEVDTPLRKRMRDDPWLDQ